jgi:hypothetical protein
MSSPDNAPEYSVEIKCKSSAYNRMNKPGESGKQKQPGKIDN